MDKRFDHKKLEKEIYKKWDDSGYFNPDNCVKDGITKEDAEPFSIVLPPPNVTANLHIGHAAMLVLEDIMVRCNRMKGRRTLWLPGTDHAAIATQSKLEKKLYDTEGKTRHDLGRENFLKKVDEFAKKNHDNIVNQVKAMGSSLDWSREAFTLDPKRSLAVRTAFKRMYDAGLIIKGERIVNWDPKMQTTVSDDEIEYVDAKDPFYYFQYGPFVIGTARPETKFGDKYVVMHPNDKRYKKYNHGDKIDLEWINGFITATIIKDEAIDPEFGTGVMTITPWHDATDFEIAERHNLDKEQIIDFEGKLMPIAGDFEGMPIEKARSKIVEKLKNKNLLVKVDENYTHRVAVNYRGGGKIEPQIKDQWFVSVNKKFVFSPPKDTSGIKGIKKGEETTLKELMNKVIESGQINIVPDRFRKVYFHWIENLRDWCISRQIWYGHRIPVYYCTRVYSNSQESQKECRGPIVSVEKVEKCPHCGGEVEQDPDTLDTWFSSGLWTFSTLGWPEDTEDLSVYHPTSALDTGYDIIFFWVARMILMSTYLLGEVPFHNVYLHGLVRDTEGRKMSKSLGNVIDPLDVVEEFGADAVRLSLVIGSGPGNDLNISKDKIKGFRNFTTKIWNASRFMQMSKPDGYNKEEAEKWFTDSDKKVLDNLEKIKEDISGHYDRFEFHLAGEKAYDYFWNEFANGLLENLKLRIKEGNKEESWSGYGVLEKVLFETIKMLHPFMPFVTEEVYKELNLGNNFLMVERW